MALTFLSTALITAIAVAGYRALRKTAPTKSFPVAGWLIFGVALILSGAITTRPAAAVALTVGSAVLAALSVTTTTPTAIRSIAATGLVATSARGFFGVTVNEPTNTLTILALILTVAGLAIGFFFSRRPNASGAAGRTLAILLTAGGAAIPAIPTAGGALAGLTVGACAWLSDRLTADKSPAQADNATTASTTAAVDETNYAFLVQPMVDPSGDELRIMAYELLLREYNASEQRWQVPADFDLPVEKLIELMNAALTHLTVKRLSLNLTPERFTDDHVMNSLVAFTQYANIDGLIIELTHAPATDEMKRVAPVYHDANIRIAIDGAGSDNHFESLQTIFPYVDGVKFALQKLRRSDNTANLDQRLDFWYDLAASYNIDLIMEGIENKADEQYALERKGIQYLQGYLYGKPELPAELEATPEPTAE